MGKHRKGLTLAATTLWDAPISVRLAAAAAAGFDAIGVHHRDLERASEESIAAAVESTEIRVDEVGFFHRWADPGAEQEARSLLRLARRLGARRLVTGLFDRRPEPAGVAGLRELCRRAGGAGLGVALEFFSYGGIPTAADACRLIEQVDEPNLGLLVDTWQAHRGGGPMDRVGELPRIPLMCVQLGDAAPDPWEDAGEESRRGRLMPGQGVIDLAGLLRRLAALTRPDSLPPVAVEVMADETAARDSVEVARAAYASATAVLRAAGWS